MYLVVIAWLYVTLMMAVAEAANPTGSILGAVVTFALYGLLPLSIVIYIMGTPARRRKRHARELAERQAWLAQLDEMLALKPAVVVPGHMQAGTAMDASAIAYTRDYLQRFDAAAAKAGNSGELINAMKQAYPQAGMALSLDIGAKVNKGEMPW
jgi:hypothetical protein